MARGVFLKVTAHEIHILKKADASVSNREV
jgi:hypothetical protein